MDTAAVWKRLFTEWPEGLARRGVLVTAQEQIVFRGFLISEELLLVERNAPDTMGARMVLVPLGLIVAVKITDVVKGKVFTDAGFSGRLSG